MKNLITLILATSLIGAGDAGASEGKESPDPRRPNIVFILADDLGWSDLPAYGNTYHETPAIDQLANDGALYTNAYAAAPVCSPTRAAVFSGQYPARVGVTDWIKGHWRPYEKILGAVNKQHYLPLENITFAEALKEAGYKTGYFGKWHLGGEEHYPNKQGFDDWFVTQGWGHFFPTVDRWPKDPVANGAYLTDVLTEKTIDFIRKNKDETFVTFLSHFAVHIPLEAKPETVEKYEAKAQSVSAGPSSHPTYAAMLEHVDTSLGQIVNTLDELSIGDNTMIIFYSDNGGLIERFDKLDGVVVTSNAPLRGEKGEVYEGGIRSPLIIKWPERIKERTVSHDMVTSVDFYPTFLSMAGVTEEPQVLDGIDISPTFAGEELAERDLFWHYPHYHHMAPASAIRSGDFKLVENLETGALELYNLKSDIGEEKNLAAVLPDVTSDMHQRLTEWRESVDARMPTPNENFDPARRYEWGVHPDDANQ